LLCFLFKEASRKSSFWVCSGAGGGIWTPYIGAISPLASFFAASLPLFSFSRVFGCLVKKGLAGGELNESGKSQMPRVRRSETLEGRDQVHAFRRITAILLPRLWSSFLSLVSCLSRITPFLKICGDFQGG
jgi:hypothetical protein